VKARNNHHPHLPPPHRCSPAFSRGAFSGRYRPGYAEVRRNRVRRLARMKLHPLRLQLSRTDDPEAIDALLSIFGQRRPGGTGLYIISNGIVKKARPLGEWGFWYEGGWKTRGIRKTRKDSVCVSTVFLGLDYNFSGGKPILYETMVFGGEYDQDIMQRYCSRAGAIHGHKRLCKFLFGSRTI